MRTRNRNRVFLSLTAFLFGLGFVGCGNTAPGGGSNSGPQDQSGLTHVIVNGCDEGAIPFGAGTGAANSPFLLCSPAHIKNLQTMTNPSASYLVVNDIDLTGISLFSVTSFSGVFDGNNHVISNLTSDVPLFNTSTGTIKNVILKGVQISGGTRGASLVSTNAAGGQVIHCSATGSVSASYMPGGLVGVNQGTITDSYANITMVGYDHTGGLVGVNLGTISHSYALGSVKAASDYIGGLVGQNSSGTISQSYSTGTVSGNNSTGGLVGDNSGGTIQNSYSLSSTSGATGVGGLVGTNNGALNFCYSAAPVIGTSNAGGLIGTQSGGSVTNCYWDTLVSGQSASAAGTGEVTSAMQNQATYGSSWDFTSIWTPPSAGSYPALR